MGDVPHEGMKSGHALNITEREKGLGELRIVVEFEEFLEVREPTT